MLVYQCAAIDGTLIPVAATVVSAQGEEILMKMDVRYERAEDNSEGKFVLDNLE